MNWAKFVAPPKKLTVSQWSDRYRMLSAESSAEPGKWNTSRAEYQRGIMNAFSDPKVYQVVWMSSSQVGKALTLDTKLPTPNGWTTMEKIKVGDILFDENGRQCKVVFATDIMFNRDVYEIEFSDGSKIKADAEHKWSVYYSKWGDKSKKPIVLTTKEMIKTGITSFDKNGGRRNHFSIPVAKPLQCKQKKLPIDPYVLGVWLGDGHSFSGGITAHIDDYTHYKRKFEKAGHKVEVEINKTNSNVVTLKIDKKISVKEREYCIRGHRYADVGRTKNGYCKECMRQFSKTGQYPHLGNRVDKIIYKEVTFYAKLKQNNLIDNKHIPQIYLRASMEQRLALLQGLMDTDGYITKKGRSEFITTSKKIAEGFGELLSSLGIKYTKKIKYPTTIYKNKRVQGKKAYRFSFMIYDDLPVFSLERKLKRMVNRKNRRITETFSRWIVDIKKIDSEPVRCIQVNSKSHLFLCGENMIPTHNTEALLNIIGYFIDQDPSPMLLLQPTLDMAQTFSKDRLAPMLRDTPALKGKVKDVKARNSGNTILHKVFPGGHITMAGANSPASLASRPVRVVLLDEVDRYPLSAGSEGDPVNLAVKRSTTFWNRKIMLTSTPTIKGISRIEKAYEESDKRKFYVPCPECGEYQVLRWANVVWEDDKPESAKYVCEKCGSLWSDAGRWKAVKKGKWVAQGEFRGIAGFWLNELYSPWVKLKDMVTSFLNSKDDPEMLKTFVNTSLGESWEDRSGEEIEWKQLFDRKEKYTLIPARAVVLTCGVDVQDDRLEGEVRAWAEKEESFGIKRFIIYGSPALEETWKRLDDIIFSSYKHELGFSLKVSCTCIDSGGHFTDDVYRYVKPRESKRVFAIKGGSTASLPIISRPSKNNKYRINLFTIGTDTAKELIYERLKFDEIKGGYYHWNEEFDEEYFKQLTAEKAVTAYKAGVAYRKWVKLRARNEALDYNVYALAALRILNPNFQKLKEHLLVKKDEKTKKQTKNKLKGWAYGWKA